MCLTLCLIDNAGDGGDAAVDISAGEGVSDTSDKVCTADSTGEVTRELYTRDTELAVVIDGNSLRYSLQV